jgi:Right handed beta helix region
MSTLPIVDTTGFGSTLKDPLPATATLADIQAVLNKAANLSVSQQSGDLIVDKSGANGAFTTIQAAVNAAQSGQRVVVHAGTYNEDVHVSGKSNVQILGEPGAIIQANGSEGILGSNSTNVTIKGLTVQGGSSPLQHGLVNITGGSGWDIESNIIRNGQGAGIGIYHTTDSKVIGNKLLDNGQEGYSTDTNKNLLFSENEIGGNNTRNIDPGWEAGGGKFWAEQNATVSNNISHDNNGPGIWADTQNNGLLFDNNLY